MAKDNSDLISKRDAEQMLSCVKEYEAEAAALRKNGESRYAIAGQKGGG